MNQIDMFNSQEAFIQSLKEEWKKEIEGKGGFCPCCEKFGKVYKIKMSQHLALCLRWIFVHGATDGWVDVQNSAPRWMMKSKTYPLLEHWGLVAAKAQRSGIWKATERGIEFVLGHRTVPSAVHIYDNRIWGFEESEVLFKQCFGKHFDFEEMMNEQFNWAKIK